MSVHAAKILKPSQKASIVLTCAHRWEAQAFIDLKSLRPLERSNLPFPLFANERGTLLLITGQGTVRAAAAVSALLSQLEDSQSNPLVLGNFGIAGAGAGDWEMACWVLLNKVTEETTNKSYYPDRLLPSPVPETYCITVPKPATISNSRDKLGKPVYDMEASAVAATAELYLSSSQLVMGKFVSDHLENEGPKDWKIVIARQEASYRQACQEFWEYLTRHSSILCSHQRRIDAEQSEQWVEKAMALLEKTPLTVSQKRRLSSRLKAYSLACQVAEEREAKLLEFSEVITNTKGETKSDHNRLLERLLQKLSAPPLFSPLR